MSKFRRQLPIVTPQWVIKQMRRCGLVLTDILNMSKMRDVCSLEDLGNLVDLNENMAPFFGVGYSFNPLRMHWESKYYEDFQKLLLAKEAFQSNVLERLLHSDTGVPIAYNEDLAGVAFDLQFLPPVDNKDDAIVLVGISPGYFGNNVSHVVQKQLLEAYLKQSYVFSQFSELAEDPFFYQYVLNLNEPEKVL
jgi:hypothetical protein